MYVILDLTETQQAQVNALLLDDSQDGPVIAQCYPDGIICRKISIEMAEKIQAAAGGINSYRTLKDRMAE